MTPGRPLHGKFLRRKAWSVGDKTCKAELSSVQSGWASTQDAWRTQGDGTRAQKRVKTGNSSFHSLSRTFVCSSGPERLGLVAWVSPLGSGTPFGFYVGRLCNFLSKVGLLR